MKPKQSYFVIFCVFVSVLTTYPLRNLSAQEDAKSFVSAAEAELEKLGMLSGRASFLNGVDETHDHRELSADAERIYRDKAVALAKRASSHTSKIEDVQRKLDQLKLAITIPSPTNAQSSLELSQLIKRIQESYTTALNCTGLQDCRTRTDLYQIMENSRDANELLKAWQEWRNHGRNIRSDYARMVVMANSGAQELGYRDTGALWRSQYELAPELFAAEYDRLWGQVKPLYEALHCHVRAKLSEHYTDLSPKDKIPAHVLGNMWAQHWTGIYELVSPKEASHQIDITELLKAKHYTQHKMVRTGERFFTSLGFPKLASAFWERSMLVQPEGKKVNCQASAWDIDARAGDVRLRMCTQVTEQDFWTIHHELGHIYYYLAYKDQSHLFRSGANPGFHEAIGDALTRSITPSYLHKIGLLDEVPPHGSDLAYLFRIALDMVPRLAMSIVVDKWRWGVFSGDIARSNYNSAWWELRRHYQGLKEPVARSENDFDAGMFYHISNNVPYDRYFIAQILQFDIHRALCKLADHTGPLHKCSIYASKKAGSRFWSALSLGSSRPWSDTLKDLTGSEKIDATAINEYFKPVMNWLAEQNKNRSCGWQ